MTPIRQTLPAPEVVRAQLLAAGPRPIRTEWGRALDGDAPLCATYDALYTPAARDVTRHERVSGFAVHVHDVNHPRLRELVAEASPRAGTGYGDPRAVRVGLALDLWLPETDWRMQAAGYFWQHWQFPRLALHLVKPRPGKGPALLDDPSLPGDTFATGRALEDPLRATIADLWWPVGAGAPPPIRAFQMIREPSIPPVPA